MSAFSPVFQAFAADCSAAAIHQQDALNGHLGAASHEVDLNARTLAGEGNIYGGVTSLGSFSHLSRTWLWSWDNPHFGWEHPAVEPARMIYMFGKRNGIPELTTGHLDLSGFPNPHQAASTMTIAAAYVLGGNGVWSCRINDGKGSAYVHLDDPQLPVAGFDPLATSRLLMTAVEVFPADHRRVVRGYFERFELPYEENEDAIRGREPDGGQVVVAFTDRGLIKAISTQAG
jgi:hypothetical protein